MAKVLMRIGKVVGWILAGLMGLFVLLIVIGLVAYPPKYIFRVLAWGESDAFDWQKFPKHDLHASPRPFHFEVAEDPRVPALLAELAQADDWEAFLTETGTQAFIVIQDGSVLYEGYFNGTQRDTIVTSFSVAKSFTSALIGIAIDEGHVGSVDDPITRYLPELLDRDPRFADITIRDLLLMASGLDYKELRFPGFNSDDPLTTYHPNQRKLALTNTKIVDPPGAYFQYNKYHPQLLGMILERSTGGTVTDYLQAKIWNPIGMEYDGSWSTDSEAGDFEKMETGVNARAIDFAKFGQLFLNNGAWEGQQVVSREWVRESTQPNRPSDYDAYYPEYFSSMPGYGYYAYMWWGMGVETGVYDFAAAGDRGQMIYMAPRKSLVVVRNGIDYGVSFGNWLALFYEFAHRL